MAHSDCLGNGRKLRESGNPLRFGDKRMACVSVASPGKRKLFFIYFHLSKVASYSFSTVSPLSRLFSRLAILPRICECILNHYIAFVSTSLKLGLLIS